VQDRRDHHGERELGRLSTGDQFIHSSTGGNSPDLLPDGSVSGMADATRYRALRNSGIGEGTIRGRVDRGQLWRPFNDTYLSMATARQLPHVRLRALLVRLPPAALICRQSAALLHGFSDFVAEPADDRVHVLLPAGVSRPRLRGVIVHETALPAEPCLVGDVTCTSPARTAVDLARTSVRMDALPVLDGALRVARCDLEELASEVALHFGLPGVAKLRALLQLADAGSQCRQESQLRLIAMDGGLPRPQTQIRVLDGSFITRYVIDLGWEESRVGAEYDGRSHLTAKRAQHDRERHNWLAARGWRMRYFTAVDIYRRPQHVVAVLRHALCT
jgi:very-short-patch-repair endonuclease